MKNWLILPLLALLVLSGCQKEAYDLMAGTVESTVDNNEQHPLRDSIDAIVAKYLNRGLPGVQVAVKNADGWYLKAGGYASVEDRVAMGTGNPGWYFSITKIHTAVLVLKEWEAGRVQLDSLARNYLPASTTDQLPGMDRITVRMLLQHSSGLFNLTETEGFFLRQLNRPFEQPTVEERLSYLADRPLLFEPGSDFSYSNTNYLLLGLLLENLTGQSYESLWQQRIAQPLGLTESWYNVPEAEAEARHFPNYYFDRHANEQLENISRWNGALANNSGPYGGVAGTPADAIRFLEALVQGEVLSPAALHEMRTWIVGQESQVADYGLGLEVYHYGAGSAQYGHEGDGIGCTTQVLYFPDNDTYLYLNVTAGRQLYGPYLFKTTDFKNELCGFVARQEK